MCGIGGFSRFGDNPINKDAIKVLGCALERRGNHATGLAWIKDTDIKVHKAAVPAWKFFTDDETEKFLAEMPDDVDTVLIHTRLATQGTPHKNANNHPLFAGKAAIIHNGMVGNDDHLFRNMNLKRMAETDSDIIRAIVDEKGLTPDCVAELNKMSGSVAAAIVHPDFPRKVMFVRSGSPLVLAWNADEKMLSWASEKDMLHKASTLPIEALGTYFQSTKTNLVFQTVMPDTAYIFSRDNGGMEWHGRFRTANYYTAPCYRVWDSYHESMRKRFGVALSKEAKRVHVNDPTKVVCRNPQCGTVLTISKDLQKLPLWKIYCDRCKTYCAEEPTN